MKFALQQRTKGDHEAQTIVVFCAITGGGTYRVVPTPDMVDKDEVPVGDVPFVHGVLGRVVRPDYYPDFLSGKISRRVWRSDEWPYHEKCFIKPSDRHKRFTGFVKRVGWKGKKKGPFWCSSIVEFVSEWRWYVLRGEIVAARWGSGIESEPPDLGIKFPPNYSAAVDFGRLANGDVELVESNSPFACGWYGSLNESALYAQWLAGCWKDLRSN